MSWAVWRDGDVYYARNEETGMINTSTDCAKLLNDIMEGMRNDE